MPEQQPGVSTFRAKLTNDIASRLQLSRRGQKWWSFATHGSTVLVVIFSIIAGVLPHETFTYPIKNTILATILSLSAAILAGIRSQLSFETKWIANRVTSSELDQLKTALNDPSANLEAINTRLESVIAHHNVGIIEPHPIEPVRNPPA